MRRLSTSNPCLASASAKIRGGHRSEQLIGLAGLARQRQRNAVQQLGLRLRLFALRSGALGQRPRIFSMPLQIAGEASSASLRGSR